MARFSKGQKIVCTFKGVWIGYNSGKKKPGPKFNDIVTVESQSTRLGCIRLVEYPQPAMVGDRNCYEEYRFEPLADITELKEILEAQPEKI